MGSLVVELTFKESRWYVDVAFLVGKGKRGCFRGGEQRDVTLRTAGGKERANRFESLKMSRTLRYMADRYKSQVFTAKDELRSCQIL